MKIIARGYTISEMNGKIIKSAKEVNVGDLVELKYIDGNVKASVTEKDEKWVKENWKYK